MSTRQPRRASRCKITPDMDDRRLLQQLADRTGVIDTVLRAARAMDRQDWPALRACLAATLDVDYSDLRGDPPSTIAADAYVAARITGLTGLKTQHVSTNHLVTLEGDRAECTSCFLIHRLNPAAPVGDDTFDTAGHYVHRLARTTGGWLFDGIVQTVLWNRGNPQVHGALRRA